MHNMKTTILCECKFVMVHLSSTHWHVPREGVNQVCNVVVKQIKNSKITGEKIFAAIQTFKNTIVVSSYFIKSKALTLSTESFCAFANTGLVCVFQLHKCGHTLIIYYC